MSYSESQEFSSLSYGKHQDLQVSVSLFNISLLSLNVCCVLKMLV